MELVMRSVNLDQSARSPKLKTNCPKVDNAAAICLGVFLKNGIGISLTAWRKMSRKNGQHTIYVVFPFWAAGGKR